MEMQKEEMRRLKEVKEQLEESNCMLEKDIMGQETNRVDGGQKAGEDKEPHVKEQADEEKREMEEEVAQRGEKRHKLGASRTLPKKFKTDNICQSSRARLPSKKALQN
ncbi:hypothetical protein EDB19DRAFT_1911332 [Suillus lakei]|nr:hypothetical protein EDB19DRAFT_1911332 [Suillus lakei]